MAAPKENNLVGDALTEREREIMSKAWRCLKTTPEIDFTKLAAECNMTNVGSASNAWSKIKKKIFSDLPSAGSSTGPAANRKRKQVTKDENNTTTKSSASIPTPDAKTMPMDEVAPDNALDEAGQNDPFTDGTASFTPINVAPKRRRNVTAAGTPRAPRTSKATKGSGTGRGRKTIKEEEDIHNTYQTGDEIENPDNKMDGNDIGEDSGI